MKNVILSVLLALVVMTSFSQTKTELVKNPTYGWKIKHGNRFVGDAHIIIMEPSPQYVRKVVGDSIQTITLNDHKDNWNSTLYITKTWAKRYTDGKIERGIEYLMFTFNETVSLMEACLYAEGLERNQQYAVDGKTFVLDSQIEAWLNK